MDDDIRGEIKLAGRSLDTKICTTATKQHSIAQPSEVMYSILDYCCLLWPSKGDGRTSREGVLLFLGMLILSHCVNNLLGPVSVVFYPMMVI